MKQNVTRRAAGVLGAAAVAVALACSDSGTSGPLERSSNNGPGAGLSADTGSHTGTGGPVGNPSDTGSKPVASFTLAVHVGTPRAGALDTLQNDPISGATITVAKFGYVMSGGNGADTVQITEVPVATGTTDANGDVSFPNLKGEPGYVIRAVPPAGLNLAPARVIIPQAYSATIKTTLVLRKP